MLKYNTSKLNNIQPKRIIRKSRYTCVVMNCYSREGPGTKFYLFPKVECLRKQWMENLKLQNISPTVRKLLCNRHFQSICFIEDTLKIKRNSVPTLELGHDESPKHLNNIEVLGNKTRNHSRKCCIKNCSSALTSIFHKFPKDPKLRREWCIACKINESDIGSCTYVCHEHFTYKYHGVRNVLKNGIPTINLDIKEKTHSKNNETVKENECENSAMKVTDDHIMWMDINDNHAITKEVTFLKTNDLVLSDDGNMLYDHIENIDHLKNIIQQQQNVIKKYKLAYKLRQRNHLQKDKKIESLKRYIQILLMRLRGAKK